MPSQNGKIRKCKYCERDAKKNIRPDGRNKGYLKTCGNKECLTQQYRNLDISKSKKPKDKNRICEHCNDRYLPDSSRQKWCKKCCPDIVSRRIMQRYNLSNTEYLGMLEDISGQCPICQKRKATVVDHCHNSNKVRGLLCNHCNTALHLVEDDKSLLRAIEYLDKHKT